MAGIGLQGEGQYQWVLPVTALTPVTSPLSMSQCHHRLHSQACSIQSPLPPKKTAALYIPLLHLHLHHTANKTKKHATSNFIENNNLVSTTKQSLKTKKQKHTKENIFTEEEKGRNCPECLICSFTLSWSFASVSMQTKQGLNLPQSTNSS